MNKNSDSKTTTKKSLTNLKSFEAYPKIIEHITLGSKLSASDIEKLEEIFGDRLQKALEIITEKRVKKYLFRPSGIIRWIIIGHERTYLTIEHSFCSCQDFLYRALLKQDTPSCYHLLAREIADRINKYETIEIDDKLFESYMDQWL
ncbi:MAG: hypothetical protein JXA54_14755 [Candidatus Heimdallarchaeota archaeon]|nr:hypothetical protein [Candidatus Heimdallarchaeota archaeon]